MFNLVIFGSPGAGKGTQSSLIADEFGLKHLSSGDLLRSQLKNGNLGKEIKKYQDAGQLVPDKLIIEMIESSVLKKMKGKGLIFDGFPRNLHQAKRLDRFLKSQGSKIGLVLNLKLSQTEAVRRIIERSKNSGRTDDNLKTLKTRLKVYKDQTSPLIQYYKDQKKVITLDGRPPIQAIFSEIKDIIKRGI